ncbi:hypothetical protein HDK77DRAFT_202481 [Phyllosticta capitalensis]
MPTLASVTTESPSAGTYTQTTSITKLTPAPPPPSSQPTTSKPFRLLDLPAEVRLRIYEHVLLVPHTIDLDPSNTSTLSPRLRLLLVSRQLHNEASHVFYSRNTFRLFPVHGRFFHTRKPLLARLSPRTRASLSSLELRLGPGWNGLPSAWGDVASPLLGLEDCTSWRHLRVFVECDPAGDDVFAGFRRSDDFFTSFCARLLRELLPRVPSIETVTFDGFPGVAKDGPLVRELVKVVREQGGGVRVAWGPERGWGHENVVKELEASIASLRLWAGRYAALGN